MRQERDLAEALARIEEVRRRRRGRFQLRDERITMSHGSGGKATHSLIENIFAPAFANPILDPMDDSAVFSLDGRLAFTTDSYVVNPIFFPGGDIGRLAVFGTVNDLAVAGAVPCYLSVAVILEEGFPISDLRRIVASMRQAADEAGVRIVTGDTKVVQKGKADGLYINTTGIGVIRPDAAVSAAGARPGDKVLVSGRIAEHGVTIMMARGDLEMEANIASDTAPLNGPVKALLDRLGPDVHCLKDATRGGVATTLNEIALQSGVGIMVHEDCFAIRPDVRGACELLGIEPLHIANEGKFVAVVAPERAEEALEALQSHPFGRDAALVGDILAEPEGMVSVRTVIGGHRVLDMLVGDALPRIC